MKNSASNSISKLFECAPWSCMSVTFVGNGGYLALLTLVIACRSARSEGNAAFTDWLDCDRVSSTEVNYFTFFLKYLSLPTMVAGLSLEVEAREMFSAFICSAATKSSLGGCLCGCFSLIRPFNMTALPLQERSSHLQIHICIGKNRKEQLHLKINVEWVSLFLT